MASSYAALVSLMRVIHDLEHHPSPPISLDKQLVESITQRITYIEEFLHFYNISPPVADNDEEEDADPLEMRIAAAAHAAEDAIEYHIVDCINQKKNKKEAANDDDEKINSANRCFGILQSVIEEMDSIKKVLMVDIYTQKKKKAPVVYDQVATRNIIPPDEISLVGSDGVLLEIMEKLAGGQLDFQVIPIVGMGGIGKTFLAKTIYTKPLIKEHFDISAWATISQQYDTGEILRELLSQAKKEKLSGMSVDELGLELHKHLFSRRFLIVMDDMWSIDSWDNIQRFFPNNGNGSRVLVTTRISQLSLQLSNDDYSLRMSFLDEASSWELFSITVFGEESSCPPELEEIGEEIVDNCRGLPLSIAVVGGLLKNMDATRSSWESIRDNFTSMVNMENDKHCLRLLKLSYNHLPVYLKPCFLYMGMFDEDKRILVSTIVQLWISEGFLKLTNGESLEATARGFLQDLIDRNLILIDKLGSTGRLRFCKMHDLVRDMCLKEGQKQGFCHVIGQCNPPTQGINVERRVFIPEYTSKETVRGELRYLSRTRSILCERGEVLFCRDMLLLRTLQGKYHSVNSINKINLGFLVFRYVNLRHIAISAPQMFLFIPSVSRLWNLHTLIVSSSSLSEPILFFDFWKTPQLRHVEFDDFGVGLPDPPNGDAVVIMENLHTLKGIRNFKCSEEIVKRIPNIKRLSLEYCRADADDDIDDDDSDDGSYDDDDDEEEEEEDDDGDGNIGDGDNYVYHVGNMKNMLGVEFLSITFRSSSSTILRQNITFPHSLKKLSVSMGYDIEFGNMLEKFGSLPLLEKLKLTDGCFEKGEWEITEEQFPSLKYLKLFCCDGLENMSAKEQDSSILPRLENLVLVGLAELKRIPFELGNIDTLKSIKLIDCGEGAVESAKEMFDEQVDLQGGEDQLSFHVVVSVREDQEHLLSLAAPNFFVKIQFARL